jgi:hypothetical protein
MKRSGFTSVELAVALAVIALVTALSVPALSKARAQAQEVGCVRSLTQTGLGWSLYALDNSGSRGLAGTNWCLPIRADGSYLNGVSDSPYYPSASAPWSLAIAGLGYVSRQTMRCPAGDGGGGQFARRAAICRAYPGMGSPVTWFWIMGISPRTWEQGRASTNWTLVYP